MNFNRWTSSVFAALVCLCALRANAAEPGFYVSASLGTGEEDPKSSGTNFGNSLVIFHAFPDEVDVDDGALAWSVGLGYRINPYLSGELEYVDFGTTHVSEHYSVDTPGAPFPFPTDITLGYSSTVWLAGAGVSWSLAKRWSIRAEYQQTGTFSETLVSGVTDLQRTTLSALFKL